MNPVAQNTVTNVSATSTFTDFLALGGHHGIVVMPASHAETWSKDRTRRVLNFSVAMVGLILCAPLLLALALLVKLTSRGPILYAQTRVGLDRRRAHRVDGRRRVDYGGKLFKIYKFRTMYLGSDRSGEVWASPNDPRVTPLGRILRKFRLDELPQLFNVLKGDMNIVGPRPEQPKIFSNLRGKISGYSHRQRVLPGITGWAQINHHYDSSVDDVRKKVDYDLEYIERRSLLEDLKIMLRTVPVVVFQKGAW